MSAYATVNDIKDLWRILTPDEEARASALIPIVCDSIRYEAQKVGRDFDMMLLDSPELETIAKSVVVDVVARSLMTSTNQEPMTQMTESAGGYSFSGSFLVPGGGLFIKKTELARLGIRKQKAGVIEFDY